MPLGFVLTADELTQFLTMMAKVLTEIDVRLRGLYETAPMIWERL